MPAMTNPSDYGWYGLTPPELPEADMEAWTHDIPPEEEEMHVHAFYCECIPVKCCGLRAYVHQRISLPKPDQSQL